MVLRLEYKAVYCILKVYCKYTGAIDYTDIKGYKKKFMFLYKCYIA